MVADERAPVNVLKATCGEAVEHLVENDERLAVGGRGQPAKLVPRKRTDRDELAPHWIHYGKLAAEGVSRQKSFASPRPGQVPWAEGQVERPDSPERCL